MAVFYTTVTGGRVVNAQATIFSPSRCYIDSDREIIVFNSGVDPSNEFDNLDFRYKIGSSGAWEHYLWTKTQSGEDTTDYMVTEDGDFMVTENNQQMVIE